MSIDNASVVEWDNVSKPEHYNKGGIEAIDGIKASMTDTEFRGYLKGTQSSTYGGTPIRTNP